MTKRSLQGALWRGLLLHAMTIPLWVGRVAIGTIQDSRRLVFIVLADVLLAFMHRAANRMPERVDWGNFGRNESWTKAYYFPEAICWYLIVRDLLKLAVAEL